MGYQLTNDSDIRNEILGLTISSETELTDARLDMPVDDDPFAGEDLSIEYEHAMRVPDNEVEIVDDRLGRKVAKMTCKVCGGLDVHCSSTQRLYKGGCGNCFNIIDGEPCFPKRGDDWYKAKRSRGHKSPEWKMFCTTYRKEAVRLGLIKSLPALVLEHIVDLASNSGFVELNHTTAAKTLNTTPNTLKKAIKELIDLGAIITTGESRGSSRHKYVVVLQPLEDSPKVGKKGRIAAFLKAVVPTKDDGSMSRDVTERFKVGEATSAPILGRE